MYITKPKLPLQQQTEITKLINSRRPYVRHITPNLPGKSFVKPIKPSNKSIIHVYSDSTNQGFGDFLRGSILLAEIAEMYGVNFKIDLSSHSISKYVVNHEASDEDIKEKVVRYFIYNGLQSEYNLLPFINTFLTSSDSELYIYTNLFYNHYFVTQSVKECIKKFLSFKSEYYEEALKTLSITGLEKYSVLHIRCSDNYFDGVFKSPEVLNEISKLKLTKDTIVISNNLSFKKLISEVYGFHYIHTESIHTCKINSDHGEDLKWTILDMIVLAKASSISCFTFYGHGSGFSEQIAVLWDIPYRVQYIREKSMFITFGGGGQKYFSAAERLYYQVKQLCIFDFTYAFTENGLKKGDTFWSQHKKFIEDFKRGYGYWIWKPYLIKKNMEKLSYGDTLLYLDAGCEVDISKRESLCKLMNQVRTDLIIGTYTFYKEKQYTKVDLIEKLEMNDEKYMESIQRQAGALLFLVCEKTVALVDDWYNLACDYHNIDDTPSIIPNKDGFIEHRHDQSIFSLLTKKYNIYSEHSLESAIFYARNLSGNSKKSIYRSKK